MDEMPSITATIVAALRGNVPGYRAGEGLSDEDIRSVLFEYLTDVLAGIAGLPRPDSGVLERVMRRRAEEGITLADMLHSYRVGVGLLWQGLARLAEGDPEATDALVAATPAIFELLDRYSLRANEVHHEIALHNARRVEQVRASLLDTVLAGEPGLGATFFDAVALLGMPREGCFVLIEMLYTTGAGDATVPEVPVDLEGQVAARPAVEATWFRLGSRSQIGLVLLHANHADSIDLVLRPVLDHTAVYAGASSPFRRIGDCATARAQAHVAVSAARPSRRLVRHNHDLLPVLLASAPQTAASIVEVTLGPVLDLPDGRGRPLLDTVGAWLEHNQSVAAAAAALHCHRNTVNYRLRRFQDLTAHPFSDNAWLAQVVLAIEAERRERPE